MTSIRPPTGSKWTSGFERQAALPAGGGVTQAIRRERMAELVDREADEQHDAHGEQCVDELLVEHHDVGGYSRPSSSCFLAS